MKAKLKNAAPILIVSGFLAMFIAGLITVFVIPSGDPMWWGGLAAASIGGGAIIVGVLFGEPSYTTDGNKEDDE